MPQEDPNCAARRRDGRNAVLAATRIASGQITLRKVDGWRTWGEKLAEPVLVDLAA
jgi:hypothetical protein